MSQRHPIFELSSTIVDEVAALQPTLATFLGVAGHDHRWDDASPTGHDAYAEYLRSTLARVEGLPPAETKWDRLGVRVAESVLESELEIIESGDHLLGLDSLASRAQDYRQVFDHMGTETPEHWAAISSRLEALPVAFDNYRELLEHARSRGTTVARRQVEAVIDQCSTNAGDTSFFVSLPATLEATNVDDADLIARVQAGVEEAQGAFASFADYLANIYLDDAVPDDAVGRERYLRSAHRFLGTQIDPEDTYAWGWSEVGRLRESMASVATQIAPGASVGAALDILKTDPERAAADRKEFVEFIDKRLSTALSQLAGTHFDVPSEITDVTVQLSPPGGPLGAYYAPPSEDWSRPGSVWWSLEGDGPFPLYDEVSTAYHEGFPGHHLQVGIQMSMSENLSRLHRMMMWLPGMGEGWALYSEMLMNELGYFEKPDYVFGWLAGQMLRACRVVIDIGSHLNLAIPVDQPFHPGEDWSFDLGVEMLRDYATLGEPYAVSEMTRYLGFPGQAIAYKVGERAILEIRDELRTRPGFDLKQFHADLLEIGPVGLDLAREMMLDE